MQLTANLSQILPVESGIGRNGEWKKQNIILETDGQYSKKICITIWNDKINTTQWQLGERLTVDFDIESKEFNGRWYTTIKALKIESICDPQTKPDKQTNDLLVDHSLSELLPRASISSFDDLPF